MKNKTTILIVLILIIILGFTSIIINLKSKNMAQTDKVDTSLESAITYNDTEYGFTFSLPLDWKGYTVVKSTWQGSPLNNSKANESGPKLLIRNPNWTEALPYEDIPILIFTLDQWGSYNAEDFAISAAPIPASELARNNVYVFALPPRWNFDYSQGYEEAENIIKSNPIKAFDIGNTSIINKGNQALISKAQYNCDNKKTIMASYYQGPEIKVNPGEMPKPNGSVSVSLDGRTTQTLSQTIAADGARYANNDESFVFWNKGNSVFIMKNNNIDTSYNNCIDTETK